MWIRLSLLRYLFFQRDINITDWKKFIEVSVIKKSIFQEINLLKCSNTQKHPFRGVLRKSFSENMHQMYSGIPMLFNFIEITLRNECSSVNLLHIFRTSFPRNTFRGLLPNTAIRRFSDIKKSNFTKSYLCKY